MIEERATYKSFIDIIKNIEDNELLLDKIEQHKENLREFQQFENKLAISLRSRDNLNVSDLNEKFLTNSFHVGRLGLLY